MVLVGKNHSRKRLAFICEMNRVGSDYSMALHDSDQKKMAILWEEQQLPNFVRIQLHNSQAIYRFNWTTQFDQIHL